MKRFVAGAIVAMAAAFGPLIAQAQRCDVYSIGGSCVAEAAAQFSFLQPVSAAAPAPAMAWIMALGFLGIVVLRRTRSGPMM